MELAADVPVQGSAVCCSVCSVCCQAGEQLQTREGPHHPAVHPPAQQQVPAQHQVVPPAVPRLVSQQRLVCNELVSGTARGSSSVVYQHKPSMALVVTWCPNTAKSIPLFATLICGSGNFKRTSRNLRKTWEQRFRVSLTCALFSSS